MTEMETATINAWQENNDRYLAAALAWLRRRLRRLADDGPVADLTVAPRESGGRRACLLYTSDAADE